MYDRIVDIDRRFRGASSLLHQGVIVGTQRKSTWENEDNIKVGLGEIGCAWSVS
jgi:hypothetical protein